MKLKEKTLNKIKDAVKTAIFKKTETIVTSYKDLRIQRQMTREQLESYLKRYEKDRRKTHGYNNIPKALLVELQKEFNI